MRLETDFQHARVNGDRGQRAGQQDAHPGTSDTESRQDRGNSENDSFAAPASWERPHRPGRRFRRLWPLLALLLTPMVAGCASMGHDFPVDYVSSIEKNTTTQSEIKSRFGDPWRVGVEDGQTTWTYGKYKYRLFGQPSTTDLVVRFDSRGVVSSYSFSTTEH